MNQKGLFGKLIHGGDYNPEQWLEDPEILKTDIEYFKKAHINEVSMGIFSWTALEPAEGVYDLDWMAEIIDRLYANDILVMLATPSAARPKWMTDKYPQVLRVDPKGQRDHFGRRHNHCYTSPIYREKIRAINQRLSERFGKHPGVITWHISNELEGSPYPCFCPLCQDAFRTWLEKKYQNIQALNKAWATTFWSHTYQDFAQIEPPFENGETSVHGLNLDWKRFVTDQVADFLKWEIRAVKESGSDLPITINMMYDFPRLNYGKFRDLVDFISWDNYPQWHKKPEPLTASDTAMQHDYMRSLKKQPFYLMESTPSNTNWNPVSKLKRPGLHHAASLQAIAHGSDSVQYFQLRKSRGSFEKFHGAVIDHYGGCDTRVFREVTEVGDSLEKLLEVTGSNVVSHAAILYDTENRWALENAAGPRNCGLHYKETTQKIYDAFRRRGLNVDLIDMEQDLTGYKIIAAPMLYMFRNGIEEKIRAYIENGGTFILTYWSGIVDENDLCFLKGTPHGLMDVFGLRMEEIDALYDWDENVIRSCENAEAPKKEYTCRNLCELVKPGTAKALFTYTRDFYKGYPAVTVNSYGKGKAFYICADLEQAFYDDFLQEQIQASGIHTPLANIPAGIEVTTRQNETTEYLFIQNFNPAPVSMDRPQEGWTLLLGHEDTTIPAYGTLVYKRSL